MPQLSTLRPTPAGRATAAPLSHSRHAALGYRANGSAAAAHLRPCEASSSSHAHTALCTPSTLAFPDAVYRARSVVSDVRCAAARGELSGNSGYTPDPSLSLGMTPTDYNPLGPEDQPPPRLPSQGESIVRGVETVPGLQVAEREKPPSDVDYLQELIAIQANGPKNIGFFGTRNMGFLHQQLIEIVSYALVLTENHIFTSGATGTNAAVIRGALRAERPDLLTVVLPQSLSRQPNESQELLQQVENVIETPENDDKTLMEASRICNQEIISRVAQVICFAFHDSSLLLETCRLSKEQQKIVTLFYLD